MLLTMYVIFFINKHIPKTYHDQNNNNNNNSSVKIYIVLYHNITLLKL